LESEPEPFINLALHLLQITPNYSFLIAAAIIVGLLIICSALFSASENAYFSLSPNDLSVLSEEEDKRSKKAIQLVSYPDKSTAAKRLLAAILIMNNFINIAIIILASLGLEEVWKILELNYAFQLSNILIFLVEVVFITFLLVLFGEVIPKIYATQNNLVLVRLMAKPLYLSRVVLKPLIIALTRSSMFFDRYIKKSPDNVSLEELNQAIEIASEDDNIEEKNILKGIVNFGNISVKQIMRPRMDVCALDSTISAEELFTQASEWGYSRVPIYRESFDNIEGILYIKDLIPLIRNRENINWQNLMRKPFFVPENKKIDDLLAEFQERRIHMAIVVDEYGGSSGIVTMEDVLEEIFGEMADEFDEDEIVYSKLDENNFVFEGKVLITDLVKILDVRNDLFDEVKGEADTLGGLIMEINQSIPSRGDEIESMGFKFKIESADRRRIKRVKVIRIEVEENTEDLG